METYKESEETGVLYKCTVEYDKPSKVRIRWDNPDLDIACPISEVIVSQKNGAFPVL